MARVCLKCGKRAYSDYCFRCKPHTPIAVKKRPKQKGKRAIEYEIWRDFTAIPYLTKNFGYRCALCGRSDVGLDVDHIQKRGSHPELKMVLSNVRFLCRACHTNVT